MSDVIEIYICREGQSLKEGKIELAHGISDKRDAEADAKVRCRGKPLIQKLAYYKVSDNGDFTVLFTFDNPDFRAKASGAAKKPVRRKKKAPPPSLIEKVKKAFR